MDDLGQRSAAPDKNRVTEGIKPGFVRPTFMPFGVLHALAHNHEAVAKPVRGLLDLGKECLLVQVNFRKRRHNVWRVVLFALLGENSASSDPASSASHHLDNKTGPVIGSH